MEGVAAMSMRLTHGCGSLGVASHAWVVCQLKRLMTGRRLLRRSASCVELRLAGVARRIGHDGKWSVVVILYRRVCIVSIHILTFMNVCVPCTYKCITSWTCMYNLHTFRYIHVHGTDMYVHVCDFMNMCEHVHTCLYHVQTRMYRFAQSCPGGQDSRCAPGRSRTLMKMMI